MSLYACLSLYLSVCLSQTMVAVWVKTTECQFYICIIALSLFFVKAHTFISCRPFEIRKQPVPVEFGSQYTVRAKSLDLLKPLTKAWFTFVLSFYIFNYIFI